MKTERLWAYLICHFSIQTRYRTGGGETICPPADGSSTMAKISADLRPQSARLWWPRQLRHGTDRRTDRARAGHNKNKINYNDSLRRELTKSVETDCACLVNIAY